jgi:hypothetical protein
MNTASIKSKAYDAAAGVWVVACTVTTTTGTREGTEIVAGPDTLTDAELQAALIAKYI